jgi:preprotein translocase subunit YajC
MSPGADRCRKERKPVILATLLAQSSKSNGGAAQILIFIPLILVFYFLMIRPQRAKMRAHQDLLGNLEVGDEVETVGGIIGTIRGMTDDEFLLEAAPATTLRVSRGAVRRKIYQEEDVEEEQESPDSSS